MRVGIGIAALGLLLSGCAGTPKHPTWGNATGGEQHERLMWKAIHDKDWGNVERHLSPTFIGVNAQGQMLDRIGWLAYWKSVQPAELSLGELAVQPEGIDMKVTCLLQIQGSKTSRPAGGFRVISIWQPVKKRWALTATSITPVQNN
jgi:hypothetical protein